MNKRVNSKVTPGDVYAIPLPNGKYAFGRVFKDACISIYKDIGETVHDLPQKEEYQFTVGVYRGILKSGKWQKVDHRPFHSVDEQWPPPMCLIDKISG